MKWKMMHTNWLSLTLYKTVGFLFSVAESKAQSSHSWNKNKLLSLEVSLLYLVTHTFIMRS